MTEEIEDRLRADAEQDSVGPVPSFGDALDVAMARRSRVPLFAVAASVVVVAGVAAALAVLGGGGDDAPAPAGASVSGLAPTRGSEVLQRIDDAGFEGVLLVPGDPAALDVVVSYSKEKGACSLFDAEVSVVKQDAASVRLRASGYSYLPKPKKGQKYIGFSCSMSGRRAVRIHLAAPLGARTVRDDVSDTKAVAAAVDPADLPEPSYLPAGYVAGKTIRAGGSAAELTGERDYTSGVDSLVLRVGATRELDDFGSAESHSTVAGHPATITREATQRCLTWSTRPGISRQLCSSGERTPLASAQLLRIARSLR